MEISSAVSVSLISWIARSTSWHVRHNTLAIRRHLMASRRRYARSEFLGDRPACYRALASGGSTSGHRNSARHRVLGRCWMFRRADLVHRRALDVPHTQDGRRAVSAARRRAAPVGSWSHKGEWNLRVAEGQPRLSPFQLGVLTTLANPRSAMSVASIFATAMPSHPSFVLSLSVMMLMVMISACWYAAVACVFAIPYLADGYRSLRRWIDCVAGACLMVFGAKLAVEP
jgi:hypothetical protein